MARHIQMPLAKGLTIDLKSFPWMLLPMDATSVKRDLTTAGGSLCGDSFSISFQQEMAY